MTELLSHVDAPSDAELISRVRGGDVAAYGELFARHRVAAVRLARQLVRGPDADDLVSDAFAKVLGVLQGGGGPDVAFRAYLLTSVRRLHVDKIRASSRLQTTDDLTPFDPGVPFQDTAIAGFESGAAAKAFASLPERWQLVLWHLEIEGSKPADIAPLLGMTANSVSALAYRAREGLRQAFLTMHLSDISESDCRWTTEHLGAFVRKGLSKRDATKVQNHLDECRRCMAMYLELTDVNSNLAAIIGPLLLGAAASGYLASSGGVGTAGLLTLVGRVRDGIAANAGAATAGAVASGVAAAAVAGFVVLHHGPSTTQVSTADKPLAASTAPAVPGGSPTPQGAGGSGGGHSSNSPSGGASTDASGPSAPPSASTPPVATTTVPTTSDVVPAAVVVPPATGGGTGTGAGTGGQPGAQSGGQQPGTQTGGHSGQQGGQTGSQSGQHNGDSPGTGDQTGGTSGGDTGGQTGGQGGQPGGQGDQPGTNPGGNGGGSSTPGGNDGGAPGTNGGGGGGTDTGGGSGGGTGTGTGSGGTTTPPAGPISTVTLSTPSVMTGHVLQLRMDGAPSLPPTFTMSLNAGTSGISFRDGGNCAPVGLISPTMVTCTTKPPAKMLVARASEATSEGQPPFTATVPLDIPSTVTTRTSLTLTVGLPDGYVLADGSTSEMQFEYNPPTRTADLQLTAPSPVNAQPDGTYAVTASISGVPDDYSGTETFTVTGAALTGTGTTGCIVSSGTLAYTLTCDGTGGYGSVDMTLKVANTSTSTNPLVTITLDALDGYQDPTPNVTPVTLSKVPPAVTPDVTIDLPATISPDDDGTYYAPATLGYSTGFTGDASFTVSGATLLPDSSCTASGHTLTCSGQPTSVDFHFDADQAGKTVTITTSPGGHVATVTLEPVETTPPESGLSVTVACPATPKDDPGRQECTLTVTGAKDGDRLRFTVANQPGHSVGFADGKGGTTPSITVTWPPTLQPLTVVVPPGQEIAPGQESDAFTVTVSRDDPDPEAPSAP
ncbi:MAG TPA: sigma-70 family RNA polymerase sigma factor [Nocardioidaceae bacterium]|nr:sigma-70 family RNA polymerase sigma factor [Nocardioidaceae bacterium]